MHREFCLVGWSFFLFLACSCSVQGNELPTFLLPYDSYTNDTSCSLLVWCRPPGLGLIIFQASSLFSFLSFDSFFISFDLGLLFFICLGVAFSNCAFMATISACSSESCPHTPFPHELRFLSCASCISCVAM